MDRKAQLVEVFADTQRFYTENPSLAEAVEKSRNATRLYAADDYPGLPIRYSIEQLMLIADDPDGSLSAQAGAWNEIQRLENGEMPDLTKHPGVVAVAKSKTFEAAIRLHREYSLKKIAVLNFASAIRPGGGVKGGSSAQEESLCRCSTLFPTLDRRWLWGKYYDVNRAANDVRHSDACIYSPGVIICKTDESIPERLSSSDWVTVDMISCAAPNFRNEPSNWQNPETGAAVKISELQLFEIHFRRAKHILTIAAANHVDILVLGAFGCGAFCNDPTIVAKAYRAAIPEYRGHFDRIEFAIYCRDNETENYDAFRKEMELLQEARYVR